MVRCRALIITDPLIVVYTDNKSRPLQALIRARHTDPFSRFRNLTGEAKTQIIRYSVIRGSGVISLLFLSFILESVVSTTKLTALWLMLSHIFLPIRLSTSIPP
jgi:hypothetical protein